MEVTAVRTLFNVLETLSVLMDTVNVLPDRHRATVSAWEDLQEPSLPLELRVILEDNVWITLSVTGILVHVKEGNKPYMDTAYR